MSEKTIARWNAIPLARQELEPSPTLKRPRPQQEDASDGEDDDDNVSLVSRSPSPPSPGTMDVDKYDEYIHRPAREVITVDTRIRSENKGFALLQKMGWTEGRPLGLSEDGRVDPIPFRMKSDSTGIGKLTQDVEMMELTVSQRRELDSEKQQKENEDQRRTREEAVARKAAVEEEISITLKAFYCSLCDKQFKNVAQYDEHTNSYAHHHKARMKDMQTNARPAKEDADKRREKERRREEKELRKIAAAAGMKMPKVAPSTNLAPVASTSSLPSTSDMAPKKSGWATVGAAPSQSGFKKLGWAAVGSSSSDSPPIASTSSSWSSGSTATSAIPSQTSITSAGWASLDASGTSNPSLNDDQPPSPPPSQPSQPAAVPPPQPPSNVPVRSNWQQFKASGRGRR
ncbi:hypothetical protein FA15DRAFT_621465 [Coprinopsis marcescibilis]|uniref:G-patch domain-containing protein n=1 Tax=Coprinopsis marcescibilis TaxID=230819 RepID=A0A5C3KSD4_COPMA|nr:hypothetical protein FA15DRAFT_621465 [Coprinopsis marcescibilis]